MRFDVNNIARAPLPRNFLRKCVQAFAREFKLPKNAEVSIAFVKDKEIQRVNRIYRGENKATDVLSFPDLGTSIGEVIICYPQALRQAKKAQHSVEEEVKILLVHGLVHLLGYDHKTDKEEKRMRRRERRIIKRLKSKAQNLNVKSSTKLKNSPHPRPLSPMGRG